MEPAQDPHNKKSTQKTSQPILLTVDGVAHLLGIGVRSVWRLSGSGILPKPISLGRSKRWLRQDVEQHMIEQSHALNQ